MGDSNSAPSFYHLGVPVGGAGQRLRFLAKRSQAIGEIDQPAGVRRNDCLAGWRDVVVITVAGSALYQAAPSELEAQATEIAEQAIRFIAAPLESIALTFYEGEVASDQEKKRGFIFLVMENRPVLQPYLDVDATGSLTLDEIQAAVDRLGETLAGDQRECLLEEAKKRAHDAGDPARLNPEDVEFLTAETWRDLDAIGKRLILTAAITTKALFVCVQQRSG